MSCPFLKEAQVKYCRTSPLRSLIPIAQAPCPEESCSSEAHAACPVFRQQPEAEGALSFGPCPLLHQSLMQYCAAAPVTKFVPYSESLLSRCGNDGHRYCELYLQMAHPQTPAQTTDGFPMPEWLQYTANHMWLDTTGDGRAHIGIDSFLSRALGNVERISFVPQRGCVRPIVVVTVNGIDFEITLPFAMLLNATNLYLRANPARLTSEPYTGGWLFEGELDPKAIVDVASGEMARQWMDTEVKRMSEFLQQIPGPAGQTAADGGLFSAGLASYIERDQMRALFHEFFSPYASRK